ncbi:MAG: hypothetical protein C0497_09235 [Gemmatimonas sp.]|nr:hypothetical protein [Gemmatimonas sp.]
MRTAVPAVSERYIAAFAVSVVRETFERDRIALSRLAYDQDRSQREIARCLALSQSTINEYLRRFTASGLSWPLPGDIDEAALDQRLFAYTERVPVHGRAQPDWTVVHQELRRTGVTLHLLWLEYKAAVPDGYQYTQFCHHYHTWAARIRERGQLGEERGRRHGQRRGPGRSGHRSISAGPQHPRPPARRRRAPRCALRRRRPSPPPRHGIS